jgi:hypothetical protein
LQRHEDVDEGTIEGTGQVLAGKWLSTKVAGDGCAVVGVCVDEGLSLAGNRFLLTLLLFARKILVVVVGHGGGRQNGVNDPRIVDRGRQEKEDQEIAASLHLASPLADFG